MNAYDRARLRPCRRTPMSWLVTHPRPTIRSDHRGRGVPFAHPWLGTNQSSRLTSTAAPTAPQYCTTARLGSLGVLGLEVRRGGRNGAIVRSRRHALVALGDRLPNREIVGVLGHQPLMEVGG